MQTDCPYIVIVFIADKPWVGKIEVPTGDTQPQFQLGDTAADIERRRGEREERDERED